MASVDEEAAADLEILSLANEKGKFAIEIGARMSPLQKQGFERGIDKQYFTLVDVSPIANHPDRLFRIFRLTPLGVSWLNVLRGRYSN